MENWARQYMKILLDSRIEVKLLAGYVDDGRQVTSVLEKGMKFNEESKKFEYCPVAYKEDMSKEREGETNNQRMARRCNPAMNIINNDLKFTTESQEDFEQERLPTLDFEMWMKENNNQIGHSYFQKTMKTPYVLMERSGTSYHQKFQILSNELCRRLSNIQIEQIEKKEVLQKIEQFIKELKNSGYRRKQSRELVIAGIKGWETKIKKRKRQGIPFYRPAQTTVETRLRKELLEKENWYKEKENKDPENESHRKKIRLEGNRSRRSNGNHHKKIQKTQKNEIKSIIFVPHTNNSELAQELRKKEETIANITGDKVKIVEKAGKKLENLLAGKDPWKGKDCGRPNCFLCSTKSLTGKETNKDCTKKNVVYEIVCLSCEQREKDRIENLELEDHEKAELVRNVKKYKYIGETSRSMYDRGYEHLDKLATLNSDSHMLKHMVTEHEGEDFHNVKWGMFVRKFVRSSFERQIEEAVSIEREKHTCHILNSRSEYYQSCLPRLETRINDKEWEAIMKTEKENDEKVESKIRELRKKKNKARLTTETNKIAKRQKTSENSYISIRSTWGAPTISAPQKNSLEQETNNNNNIKRRKTQEQTERLTNITVLENKIIEGENLDMEKLS